MVDRIQYISMRLLALGSGQQHRAEPVATAAVAKAEVVRVEQPSVGTIAIPATPEPTIARAGEVGAIVAPGLDAARDRLVLLSFM